MFSAKSFGVNPTGSISNGCLFSLGNATNDHNVLLSSGSVTISNHSSQNRIHQTANHNVITHLAIQLLIVDSHTKPFHAAVDSMQIRRPFGMWSHPNRIVRHCLQTLSYRCSYDDTIGVYGRNEFSCRILLLLVCSLPIPMAN